MTKRDIIVQTALDRCPPFIGTADEKAGRPLALIKCGYVMGATGWICDTKRLTAQANQYPSYADKIKKFGPQWIGKKCYDCAQLSRTCAKAVGYNLVSGATSQWNQDIWEAKGTIDTLPEDSRGIMLFRQGSNGKMEHVAVCLGDGTEAEALGHEYGVVRRSMIGRSFTHWARLKDIDKEGVVTVPTTPVAPTKDPVRLGARGPVVVEVQGLLNKHGILVNKKALKADGIFGPLTETAVKTFQGFNGLKPDGIVGSATWAALDKEPGTSVPQEDVYTVTIPGLTLAAAEALLTTHPGATKAVG